MNFLFFYFFISMTIQKINSMVKWAHDVISFLYKRSEQLKNKREEDWVGFEPAEFLKYWKQTLLKRKMPERAGEKVLPQKWWTRGAGICVFNYKPFIYFYVRCILREISRFCYKNLLWAQAKKYVSLAQAGRRTWAFLFDSN